MRDLGDNQNQTGQTKGQRNGQEREKERRGGERGKIYDQI